MWNGARALWITGAAALTLVAAQPARAEPVAIQSGSFSYDTGDPDNFWVSGNGFRLRWSGFDNPTFSGVVPPSLCYPTAPCTAGSTVDFSTQFHGLSANVTPNAGTINGVAYNSLKLTGDLNFMAPATTFPATSTAFAGVTEPFTFTGHLTAVDPAGGSTVFDSDLLGGGTASLVTIAGCANANCSSRTPEYGFAGVDYTFTNVSPTPEPATVLLLGSGLIAVIRRRRRIQ